MRVNMKRGRPDPWRSGRLWAGNQTPSADGMGPAQEQARCGFGDFRCGWRPPPEVGDLVTISASDTRFGPNRFEDSIGIGAAFAVWAARPEQGGEAEVAIDWWGEDE